MIGNGNNTSLWFDPWLHGAPIASGPHDPIICHSGLHLNAHVNDIINGNCWSLPSSNFHPIVELRARILAYGQPSIHEDISLWDGIKLSQLKVSNIYSSIRLALPTVPWHCIVWYPSCVPRFSFILWLAFKKRLKTMDIIAKYCHIQRNTCLLCNTHEETFNHIFYQCSFSYEVLFTVFRHCGWKGSDRQWNSLIDYVLKCKGIRQTISSIALGATVYYIWQERNIRFHGGSSKPVRLIARTIILALRSRLATLNAFSRFNSSYPYLIM